MPLAVILAAAAVAASIPLLWWSIARESAGTSMARSVLFAGEHTVVDVRKRALQRSAFQRARPVAGSVVRLARRLTPVGRVDALRRRLVLAGYPDDAALGRALVGKVLLGASVFAIGGLVYGADPGTARLTLWVLTTVLAYFAADLVLLSRARERQQRIEEALPDTLDQLTISVEAGLGFDAAMSRVATTGTDPLAVELARTMQETQMGVPRADALRSLAGRVSSPEIRHFATAVIQADAYGIPIADILRTQAAEQRVRRRQRAEEHAMKVQVKIIFPVIVCILPALFIVVIGPAVMRISRALF